MKERVSIAQILTLHKRKGATLQSVADALGITRQGVQQRLRRAGYDSNPRGRYICNPPIPKRTLTRLYVRERLSVRAIAERLGTTRHRVLSSLHKHEIDVRERTGLRKFPQLTELEVGESFDVAVPNVQHQRARFHRMARSAGFKVTVRKLTEVRIRVTRVG